MDELHGLLLVFPTSTGPVVRELGTCQVDAQSPRAEPYAMLRGDPRHKRCCRPRTVSMSQFGTDGRQDGWRQRRLVATAWFVGQGSESIDEKHLDPGTDRLLMLAEVAGDRWDTPASI